MSTDTDPVAAKLAEIRHDWDHSDGRPMRHIPALLGAVEAVLAEHRKITVYALSVLANDTHEPPRVWCGHTYLETENSRHLMADDDSIMCLDKPEADVCAVCFEEGGDPVEWPCFTYRAISAALTGTETTDG